MISFIPALLSETLYNEAQTCRSSMGGTMAAHCCYIRSLFLSLSLSSLVFSQNIYIVYLGLGNIEETTLLTSKYHLRLLSNVFQREEEAERAMLYSYKHSFSGFSAVLNETQATALANMEGVISVFRSKTLELHTTRSWDFLGLTLDRKNGVTPLQLGYGDDVVIGVFDSGIWPESESFREELCINPIPSRWKGECVKGERFEPSRACNRKLIGARYYITGFEQEHGPLNLSGNPEFRSARDFLGHGTHTASTAAGSVVKNVSFFGLGQGTVRGGAPRARIAVYKVCWGKDFEAKCTEADIMKAFDDALNDGVDVISVSIGLPPPLAPLYASAADIGSFHAMQLGVTVVFSAGNDGSDPSLVNNVSPWSICVAASSIDRSFPTTIILDNTLSFTGEGFIRKEIKALLIDALFYFVDGICQERNRIPGRSAKGRVVLCFSTMGPVSPFAAKNLNASGLVVVEPMTRQLAEFTIIPIVSVDLEVGTKIKNYLSDSPTLPLLQIRPSQTVIGKSPAPTVAYFSSRGPNSLTPHILKPDITAPGVNILAAWPHETPPTVTPNGGNFVKWNFQSGTSMSCPHVAGVVALIKSVHPKWSPAAIRSALITTASDRDTSLDIIQAGGSTKSSDAFDLGGGHINPLKAMDPGLVYDIKSSDYIIFLCNLGYTQEQIRMIALPNTDTCCTKAGKTSISSINYPSISVPNLESTVTIKRTVRNVSAKKNAIYFVSVDSPDGVEVVVWPRILIFSWFNDENSYYVTLRPAKKSQGRYNFGKIEWSDGFHRVRSPLVVCVNNTYSGDDSAATTNADQFFSRTTL